MADSSRTEEPTPRRLREARRKGQVPRSRDLAAAVSLWFVLAAVALAVLPRVPQFRQAAGAALEAAGTVDGDGVRRQAEALAWLGAALALPVLLAAAAAALAAGFLQTGGLFSLEPLRPKLERLTSGEGLRRVAGGRAWAEAAKSGAKFLLIVAAAALAAREGVAAMLRAAQADAPAVGAALAAGARQVVLWSAVLLLALGAADEVWQRRRHRRELRMTREEVRREHREEEGDPAVKSERQRLHRELLAQRMVLDVARATCVIVNPTHLAVALRYDGEDPDAAPVVLAKGEGELARSIVAAARAAGVPVLRSAPVARQLLACELGEAIPERLYEAVAEVMRVVLEDERGTA